MLAVVRTAAADVLFVDTAIRAGRAADFFPLRPPYVPGNGIAGRVLELTAGHGADVVFDGAEGEQGAASFGIIARRGWFSGHGMSDGGFARLDPAKVRRRHLPRRARQPHRPVPRATGLAASP